MAVPEVSRANRTLRWDLGFGTTPSSWGTDSERTPKMPGSRTHWDLHEKTPPIERMLVLTHLFVSAQTWVQLQVSTILYSSFVPIVGIGLTSICDTFHIYGHVSQPKHHVHIIINWLPGRYPPVSPDCCTDAVPRCGRDLPVGIPSLSVVTGLPRGAMGTWVDWLGEMACTSCSTIRAPSCKDNPRSLLLMMASTSPWFKVQFLGKVIYFRWTFQHILLACKRTQVKHFKVTYIMTLHTVSKWPHSGPEHAHTHTHTYTHAYTHTYTHMHKVKVKCL